MEKLYKEKILVILKKSIDYNSGLIGICAYVLALPSVNKSTFLKVKRSIEQLSEHYQNEVAHIVESKP